MAPAPMLLVANRVPAHKKKKLKRFFNFKQKKETRRKGINMSQLEIRNFNDVTGKHLNTHYFLFLRNFP